MVKKEKYLFCVYKMIKYKKKKGLPIKEVAA